MKSSSYLATRNETIGLCVMRMRVQMRCHGFCLSPPHLSRGTRCFVHIHSSSPIVAATEARHDGEDGVCLDAV